MRVRISNVNIAKVDIFGNVKKTRRVRSVSVRKIWVVRKEHFGVTACGSCHRLLHFSQLTHIVTVEVG